MTTLGIDIGASKIAAALVKNGKILRFKKSVVVNKKSSALLRQVLNVSENVTNGIKVNGIGIGIPCAMDSRGISVACTNLPHLNSERLSKIISRKYKTDVFLENDVKAAALAELKYGIGRKSKNFIFIAFGTGIGGAIIIDGKLYKGHMGWAGEFGLMPIPVYWEKAASVKFFKAQHKKWVKNAAKGFLALTYAFAPEYFVIGGGLAAIWNKRSEKEIIGAMRKMAFSKRLVLPKIILARFKDKSGAVGVALLPGIAKSINI